MLYVFALIVLAILLITIIAIIAILGALPGVVARGRNHPKADAIAVGGWFGLLFGGIFWPVVMVWAYTLPGQQLRTQDESGERMEEGGK